MNLKQKTAFFQMILKHPNILNNEFITVNGNSMYPSLVDGQKVRINTSNISIKKGDIIVYRYFYDHLTIHRVIKIILNNGNKYYVTKGDNNPMIDDYIINDNHIIGTIIG